ncbi:MAG TPA: 4-hydroxybenzoate 3-monooxygenase [Acetobacteraceae bacterium]|nr:4-hydroxybenzoate 3-monooxygenase [Acetobacteraceae bacterium]
MRTQVGIVGAGPAGLLLSHLLYRAGIESVVIEARSRDHVEQRQRAGVLEQGTVETLIAAGVGERLQREGMVHEGIDFRFDGTAHRIDVKWLSGGRVVTVYAQTEIVRDLIAARVGDGGVILFASEVIRIDDIDGDTPVIRFRHDGSEHTLACEYVAGCDGFRGVCRDAIPEGVLTTYRRDYPFAWLGILAEAPPGSHEVIYAYHDNGFALQSMRSPRVSRLYLQCPLDDDAVDWSDDRIWSELHARLAADGFALREGPITQKAITGMRSFVVEPMQYGRMFLAGDAAHIVPPTGAKGLNAAVGDVRVLAAGFEEFYRRGKSDLLARYSDIALRRIWKVERFAASLCTMLHRFDGDDAFTRRMQLADLAMITSDPLAGMIYANNYAGLPFEV